MHYGYIGLGNLGAALCGRLLKAGFPVTVYDLNPALAERLVAHGGDRAESAERSGGGGRSCHHLPAVAGGVGGGPALDPAHDAAGRHLGRDVDARP